MQDDLPLSLPHINYLLPSIRVGDQILSINGTLLENITHMQAVAIMRQTGQHVTMVMEQREAGTMI